MKAVFAVCATTLLAAALALTAGCASRPARPANKLLIDGQPLSKLLPAAERHQVDNEIPGQYRGDVMIAQVIGHVLVRHQKVAVEASDAYLDNAGKNPPKLAGWLMIHRDGGLRVLFIAHIHGTPRVVATASHIHGKTAAIKRLGSPRALTREESALWKARTLAFHAKMTPCSKEYHPVVIPVTAAGKKEIYVYLLPLAPSNRIMLGGYYRIKINAQGTQILDTHAYTHACLEVARKPGAIGAGVTEIKSPAPTAPQVYANLRYRLPIYVTTVQNHRRWKIERGRISLLGKTHQR